MAAMSPMWMTPAKHSFPAVSRGMLSTPRFVGDLLVDKPGAQCTCFYFTAYNFFYTKTSVSQRKIATLEREKHGTNGEIFESTTANEALQRPTRGCSFSL